jgi:ethanolamine ammonia-lyase small subunit
MLEFQRDHARARDAVKSPLDFDWLAQEVNEKHFQAVKLQSRAGSHAEYLSNPQLGRTLSPVSALTWKKYSSANPILVAIGDGLSSLAIQTHGANLLSGLKKELGTYLRREVPLVQFARVGISDELGELANAEVVLLLIGERPGLSTAENVSIYLTYGPRKGLSDDARNCISNIGGPGGLGIEEAAAKAAHLALKAREQKISGVGLKDDQPRALAGAHGRIED